MPSILTKKTESSEMKPCGGFLLKTQTKALVAPVVGMGNDAPNFFLVAAALRFRVRNWFVKVSIDPWGLGLTLTNHGPPIALLVI